MTLSSIVAWKVTGIISQNYGKYHVSVLNCNQHVACACHYIYISVYKLVSSKHVTGTFEVMHASDSQSDS